MTTGDYPLTARSIAEQAGIDGHGDMVTGAELRALDDEALAQRIGDVAVFARVVPEQKLRIVQALKRRGEIVAMTGDGVNDAPALKAAHIGVAMGGRGADVSRESASLVLLDDDFTSIVRAVRLGRRIFDNLLKAMAYVLAVHVPIAGLSLIPVLFGWPLVLMPVHIVFLELVIDPACSIAFEAEPEEATVMRRPPRDPRRPLFSRRTIAVSALQGTAVLAVLLVALRLSMSLGASDDEARTVVFSGLVVANLGLILSNRSWSRSLLATLRIANRALWAVVGGALLVLGAVLAVPALRGVFHFAALQSRYLLLAALTGIACIVAVELTKLLHRDGALARHAAAT
jgi:P-type Ca2+ transporter type 2C